MKICLNCKYCKNSLFGVVSDLLCIVNLIDKSEISSITGKILYSAEAYRDGYRYKLCKDINNNGNCGYFLKKNIFISFIRKFFYC